MRTLLAIVILLAAVLAVPNAAAHAAPDPPEWMTRLLHDYNDDWGSDASQSSLRDGHDLISLDLREEYNQSLSSDVLVFRLSMNFGYDADTSRPELRDVLTFKAKGQTLTREFKTTDNAKFTSNFDATHGPVPLRKPDGAVDGQRFYVEGIVKLSTLGLVVGDKISEFFVQGYGGTQKADHMVGGHAISNAEPPSEQSQPTSYRKADYALRGPTMYGRSALDKSAITAKPGDNRTITWSFTNSLGRTQSLTITAAKPQGVDIGLHSGRFTTDTLRFDVPAGTTATAHVYVLPQSNAKSGNLDLTLQTSLGGRYVHRLPVTIGEGSDAPAQPTDGAPTTAAPAKDSPSPSILIIAAAVVGAIVVARRRSR